MHDWELIRKIHGELVWTTVYRIVANEDDALDCCQGVFLEAFDKFHDRPVGNWAGLLRWMATRRAIDQLRKARRHRRRFCDLNDSDIPTDSRSSPQSSTEVEELKARLKDELSKLDERQAEAFWLRHIENMTYSEIADLLGVDANAVGVLIHRARVTLRAAMADIRIEG